MAIGSAAANASDTQPVVGWVEHVTIAPWEVTVKAKLDTGALTSSLHAEKVETFKKNGEQWVKFVIATEDESTGDVKAETFRRPVHRQVVLRGAGGSDERVAVLMNLCIGTNVYETQVTLENRDEMIYPLLLGRRLLQSLGPVDVTRTFLHNPDCGAEAPVLESDARPPDDDIGV